MGMSTNFGPNGNGQTPNVAASVGVLPAANGGTGTANTAAIVNGSVKFTCADAAPLAPTADDLWYETDTNILWFWNGTYWLSVAEYALSNVQDTTTISAQRDFYFAADARYDVFVTAVHFGSLVATTNSGSHYWTLQLYNVPTYATLGAVADTSAWAADTHFSVSYAVNVLVASLTDRKIMLRADKSGSPGALNYTSTAITYRLAHR